MGLSNGKTFLRPHQSTPNLTLVAWKKRGPPRIFGWTKTQVLDAMMRTNVRVCATFSLGIVPFVAIWMYRYQTILKPNKLEYERKKQEELLAEGAFEKL